MNDINFGKNLSEHGEMNNCAERIEHGKTSPVASRSTKSSPRPNRVWTLLKASLHLAAKRGNARTAADLLFTLLSLAIGLATFRKPGWAAFSYILFLVVVTIAAGYLLFFLEQWNARIELRRKEGKSTWLMKTAAAVFGLVLLVALTVLCCAVFWELLDFFGMFS